VTSTASPTCRGYYTAQDVAAHDGCQNGRIGRHPTLMGTMYFSALWPESAENTPNADFTGDLAQELPWARLTGSVQTNLAAVSW